MRYILLCLALLVLALSSPASANYSCTTSGKADICICHNPTDCSAMRKGGMCKDSMSCTAAGTCTCTAKLTVDGGSGGTTGFHRPSDAAPQNNTMQSN